MSSRWPKDDFSVTTFATMQASLTVAMIATPRKELRTCDATAVVSEVVAANRKDQFDYLPVVGGERAIVGMFHARAHRASESVDTIVKHMEVLSERHLIGADTGLLDFITDADTRPSRLVVAGDGFSGLATLSDLQKLPVRAALFAAITAFEMTMSQVIRERFEHSTAWLSLLTEGRQAKIQEEIERSRKADGIVDELLFTQFCDKGTIVRKAFDLKLSRQVVEKRFSDFQSLRDSLAHANDYAATPDEAKKVCAIVRELLSLRGAIATATSGSS